MRKRILCLSVVILSIALLTGVGILMAAELLTEAPDEIEAPIATSFIYGASFNFIFGK